MRQTRYTITPGAYQTSKSKGFSSGGYTTDANSISHSALNSLLGKLSGINPTGQNQNEILSALALAVSDLKNWNPSISIEAYERKREQYQKTTNSGLKR